MCLVCKVKRSTRDRLKVKIAELIEDNCKPGVEFNVYSIQTWWDKRYKRNDAPSTKRISKILPILNLQQIDNRPAVYGYKWDGETEIWVVVDPYKNAPSAKDRE